MNEDNIQLSRNKETRCHTRIRSPEDPNDRDILQEYQIQWKLYNPVNRFQVLACKVQHPLSQSHHQQSQPRVPDHSK